jgi:hypothetical protein
MSGHGYLFDENVPLVISTQLRQREPSILLHTIGEGAAPPKGTLDPDILNWIEANNCLLITNNRASMPGHLQEHLAQDLHIPGIIQLPRRIDIRIILEELLLIYLIGEPYEFQDQIVYLPLRY